MNLADIAQKLNNKSSEYKIGKLQNIRKEIKKLKRKAGQTIFHKDSISDQGWAFHYGGRKELQFNIGFEDEGFRYGLAFSLERSQSLHDISILFPKIYKLNCLIRERPEKFRSYQMWHWQLGQRSELYDVWEIKSELVNDKTFIFIGKITDTENLDYDEILKTFDDLLEIYLEVENEKYEYPEKIEEVTTSEFKFVRKERTLIENRVYNSIEKAINIDIRHTLLQQKLIEELELEFGCENVSYENPLNGKKIDVVVNGKKGFTFFEIKTGSSAKACIREAIGQLLEYAFWGGKENAMELVVVSEYDLNKEGQKYLNFLKEKFRLPIEYRRINLEN